MSTTSSVFPIIFLSFYEDLNCSSSSPQAVLQYLSQIPQISQVITFSASLQHMKSELAPLREQVKAEVGPPV